ncbi:hypothetical protein ACB092_04G126500 [Castanea dentata]
MQAPRKTHLGEPCDICGHVGYAETLVTCSHCKLAHEHIYCTRVLLHIVPEIWFCDACLSSKDIVSPIFTMKKHFPEALNSKKSRISNRDFLQSVSHSRIPKNSRKTGPLKKQLHIGTSRVKFIPPEEAVKMLSGARLKESYLPSNLGSSFAHLDTMATTSKYKISSRKFSGQNVNELWGSSPAGHSKPPVEGVVDTNSVTQEQKSGAQMVELYSPSDLGSSSAQSDSMATISKFKTSSLKISGQNVNEHQSSRPTGHSKPPVCGSVDINSVSQEQKSQTSEHKAPAAYKNGPMCEQFSLVCKEEPFHALPICTGGIFHGTAKPEEAESDLLNFLPEIEKFLPNYPALDATWCGSFEILDMVSRSEFYDGFLAYLPVTVHPKVFEISKRMPGVLLCTFLPCCNIWVDVFQNVCPTVNDIALYFFPGKFERSKEQYFNLLELVEMQDLVLRSSVNDVELLIFSSKRLHLDSCVLEVRSFLWGIFRPLEGNLAIPALPFHDMIFPACGQSSDVEMKLVKRKFSEVKMEPFDGPDVLPGFCKHAAGDTARDMMLSNSSNSVDASIKGPYLPSACSLRMH